MRQKFFHFCLLKFFIPKNFFPRKGVALDKAKTNGCWCKISVSNWVKKTKSDSSWGQLVADVSYHSKLIKKKKGQNRIFWWLWYIKWHFFDCLKGAKCIQKIGECVKKKETKKRKIRNVIRIASVRIKVCIFPQSLVSSTTHRKETQENREEE